MVSKLRIIWKQTVVAADDEASAEHPRLSIAEEAQTASESQRFTTFRTLRVRGHIIGHARNNM